MSDITPELSRGTRVTRLVLILIGTLGLLLGAYILVTTVSPKGIIGLLIWLLGALVLHDGILSPGLFMANRIFRSLGARLPLSVLAFWQSAVLLGALMTGLVIPEIIEQGKVANKTVVPLDYALGLVIMWVLLLAAIAGFTAIMVRRAKRHTQLRSTSPH